MRLSHFNIERRLEFERQKLVCVVACLFVCVVAIGVMVI